ncbi:MAG: cytochrome C oxidase subunit IV family protein [Chloroflexi bacterium]|nr:cytochrome C oxidase subunit IV family protein [Chloroflexota bacterium]MDA1002493.1 cytochrome C oxidase subunit IV family protein [Chloroflexota bacterium]
MTSDMAHGEAQLPEVEHSLPSIGPRQYVMIGVILTVITAIELWVSYSSLGNLIIPVLLILSAVKFIVVVAFFMHLRFDHPALTRFFVFGFVLATAILFALISLFWNDATIIEGTRQETVHAAAEGGAAAGAKLEVALGEFHVGAAGEAVAGGAEFDVKNDGAVPHNLRVIKTDLAPEALPVGGGVVDESQVEVVASVADLAAGATGSATATLAAGSYVLICNVPGHYQLGMYAALTVH